MAEKAVATAKASEAKQKCSNSSKQSVDFNSSGSTADMILQLQRTAGNQAVQRLIKSRALQAKLRVGQPNDIYEQEADRVAEQVMRMPEPQVSTETKVSDPARKNPIQRKCPGCKKGTKIEKEEEDEKLQKKESSGSTPKVTQELESSISAVRGRGQPLPADLFMIARSLHSTSSEVQPEKTMGSDPIASPTKEEPVMAKSESDQPQVSSDLYQKLNNSKGNGRNLPKDTRSSFESALGADFSNVKIHTGTDAIEMNKELGAQAFTHGSDIYFNAGKYDPKSSSGKHLLAHELTHTVQQGGSALLTKKQTGKPEGEYIKSDAPNIQAAWYNFPIPFTDYEFDPSIEGVKNAANIAKDTVVDSARWAKDKVVAGFKWIFDRISGFISSGIDYLNGKLSEIEKFATSSFDKIRNGLSNFLEYITSPVSMIMSAFNNLDADLLGTAWNALKSGAALVWKGIKSVVDGVFEIGTGIWNTASGYVDSLFGTVSSLIDSWPFRQLPDFLQREAKDLFNDIRSLWQRVRDSISDTLERLKAFTARILQSIESFVQKVLSYAIQKVIETVRAIKKAWEFVKKVAEDPEGFIRPIVDQLAAKLNSQAPPKAIELGHQKLQETFKSGQSSSIGNVIIQRQASTTKPERSTASSDEVDLGITNAITAAWAQLDIGKMLWESFVNMFWPPATIRAIGHEFSELWSKDWTNTVNNFFMPRNILEEPAGFFHDVWSNILVLLDFPLALWRRLNSVLMLLLGYLTIILVIIGAVGGGIAGAAAGGVGAIPGAWAGALAGLKLAGAIGGVLLASYFAAESITAIKLILELRTARQTQVEKNRDYVQIAGSLVGMAVAAVLVAILWLLSQFVAAIVRGIKAGRAAELPKAEPPKAEPPKAEPPKEKPPEKIPPEEKPPRLTELPPEEVSRLVSQRSDGTFRLNRKKISNNHKIIGEPEATVAEHAAREAYAAERAASMNNVERVYMGQEADRLINPNVPPGTELSADVVGVTRQGKYVLIESKGTEILHGLEQLEHSAQKLGPAQVVRYELVVAEEIRTPGFTVRNGILHLHENPYLINGKSVYVRTTIQGR